MIKLNLIIMKKTKNADKFEEALKRQNDNDDENKKEIEKEIKDDKTIKDENKTNNNNNNNQTSSLNPKRLYLRNLPFKISEDDIRKKFEQYGVLSEIHIPVNYKTNESFGYGYISYETTDSSVLALSKMDGQYFMGRKLHISIADEKKEKVSSFIKKYGGTGNKSINSSYKKKKDDNLKSAYANETNWNYLFINQNAVLDAVSKRLNIPKSDILTTNNPDLPVQIAAMETTIINETKNWLKTEGINLDILKGKRSDCVRSKTIIFVKNITTNTSVDELRTLLERFGKLIKFMISPSNTLCICEYYNKKHAENCVKHLSYQELNGLPLYLEYAPEGLISENERKNNNKTENNTLDMDNNSNMNSINIKEDKIKGQNDESLNKIDTENEEINLHKDSGKILFIKNLNFSTTEKQLKSFFDKKNYKYKNVEIAKHNKEGKEVSSGFGFVQMLDEVSALKAVKHLNGQLLGGHSLQISLARVNKRLDENNKFLGMKRKKENDLNNYDYESLDIDNNKLLIKNIPFESNKEE